MPDRHVDQATERSIDIRFTVVFKRKGIPRRRRRANPTWHGAHRLMGRPGLDGLKPIRGDLRRSAMAQNRGVQRVKRVAKTQHGRNTLHPNMLRLYRGFDIVGAC